jgi:hypothetical protein
VDSKPREIGLKDPEGSAPKRQAAAQMVNFLLIIGPSAGVFFLIKNEWGKNLALLGYCAVFAFCFLLIPRLLGFLGFPPWPSKRNV